VIALGSATDLVSARSEGTHLRRCSVLEKTTEVWGIAENDTAVDPFLDGPPS
jgi:hypothetical protein